MKIGFVGLGTMGAAMARNILHAGHDLVVYNRTRAKGESLVAKGAVQADSPRAASLEADIVVTCVSDTPDLEAVVLGDDGILNGARQGSLLVDCSTVSPEATRELGRLLSAKGIGMIDAPVSGGSEGAERGTLAIMVGGAAGHVEQARPILEAMGKTITHVGPLGSGQVAKAINQVVIAGAYVGVAEGMVLGLKAGLDMEKVVEAIRGGAAGSWVLDNRAKFMIDNDYPLGFRVRLHRKDLEIALGTARELGAVLPVAALTAQMENGLMATGHGDEDVSALARALRHLSGLES